MKKVLSVFMAILMVATMFSFATVAFAEDAAELKVEEFYVGGVKGTVTDLRGKTNGRSEAKAFAFTCFAPGEKGNKVVLPYINEMAAAETTKELVLNVAGGSLASVKFVGLVGSAEKPITIRAKAAARPVFDVEGETPAILLEDCQYVTVEGLGAKSKNHNGVEVRNCTNVTLKDIEFTNVGYTDYELPIKEDAEAGIKEFPQMETANILEKGSALLIGEGNTNITVEECAFDNCRAGVVVDSTKLVAEEEPAPAEETTEEPAAPVVTSGVSILNCKFSNINEAGVILNGADDVIISGGTATKVGTLAKAVNYDGTPVAVVKVNGSKDAVVEKIYSRFNESFVIFADSTGKVRFNVSDNDGKGSIGEGVVVYNNTFTNASALEIATAKNNIFSMLIGEKVKVADGEANCYHWTSKGDNKSIKKNPWFANKYDGVTAGQSAYDDYRLATGSPCLGAGVKVEDDMGTTDFYGNELGDSINIGADQGTGAEATIKLVSQFSDSFNYIIALIKNFFANIFG